MKLALISKFQKIMNLIAVTKDQSSPEFSLLMDTINRLRDIAVGKTNQGFTQMRDEYQNDIKNLLSENNDLLG